MLKNSTPSSLYCKKEFNNYSSDESLNLYLKQVSKTKLLTTKEEKDLAKKVYKGNLRAKKKLVQSNLRLVVSIAKKHQNRKMSLADLIQEGNIGLMIAADKFDYRLGNKFSTYASWWIKQAVLKAISEQAYCMKVPVYVQETLAKYTKLKTKMEKELDCKVDIKEVAKKINTPVEKIENYLGAFNTATSIDASYELNNGSEVNISNMLVDKNTNITKEIEFNNLKSDINQALDNLKEREQEVINMRYGLDESPRKTLEDIGKLYGVTKECIRQTEIRAIKKLKDFCKKEDMLSCYLY